jgi:hypothetical protein
MLMFREIESDDVKPIYVEFTPDISSIGGANLLDLSADWQLR